MVFPFDFREKENEIVFIEALEYAVPMFNDDGSHQMDISLPHHNDISLPHHNGAAEEFVGDESLLVVAPVLEDDEAVQVPIPALGEERADNKRKKNVAKALKKSSKEWRESTDPRAQHIRYLLRQLSKKVTESTEGHERDFEPWAIQNKLAKYRSMGFEFPHNNGVFELIVENRSHSYKGLAHDHKVFQDETGSLIAKFRISEKGSSENKAVFINLKTGTFYGNPEKF